MTAFKIIVDESKIPKFYIPSAYFEMAPATLWLRVNNTTKNRNFWGDLTSNDTWIMQSFATRTKLFIFGVGIIWLTLWFATASSLSSSTHLHFWPEKSPKLLTVNAEGVSKGQLKSYKLSTYGSSHIKTLEEHVWQIFCKNKISF